MSNKKAFLLEIITNLCVYCNYDVEDVSNYLNRSIFLIYRDFIINICKIGNEIKGCLYGTK